MQQMTPEQALELLDAAAAQASLTRADHVRVQIAVQTLRQAIQPPPEPERAPREYEHKDE